MKKFESAGRLVSLPGGYWHKDELRFYDVNMMWALFQWWKQQGIEGGYAEFVDAVTDKNGVFIALGGNNMKITNEQFDDALTVLIDHDNPRASMLLAVPGIYEILSEHYNNDVLEYIENQQE